MEVGNPFFPALRAASSSRSAFSVRSCKSNPGFRVLVEMVVARTVVSARTLKPDGNWLVAQVSQPAVSPTSKSADAGESWRTELSTVCGFGNPRYSRLGSLRYKLYFGVRVQRAGRTDPDGDATELLDPLIQLLVTCKPVSERLKQTKRARGFGGRSVSSWRMRAAAVSSLANINRYPPPPAPSNFAAAR